MRIRVLGIVLAGGKGTRLYPLTRERAKPAVPFGGKYRIIDFVLSNFINSGIYSIYVLTQFRSQSLLQHLNEGWQFGVAGGVFSQFDMHTYSKDLLNADYLVGFPLSWRLNGTSTRFRIYHQSSHLGDEFLINQHPARVNLNWEAAELIASQDLGHLRLYGGGEWLFARYPTELKPLVAHAGLEYHIPLGKFRHFPERGAQWVLGLDAKNTQEHAGSTGLSIVTGVAFGPVLDSDNKTRRWSLTIEHYHGPSPYSQYFYENVTYNGFRFQIAS